MVNWVAFALSTCNPFIGKASGRLFDMLCLHENTGLSEARSAGGQLGGVRLVRAQNAAAGRRHAIVLVRLCQPCAEAQHSGCFVFARTTSSRGSSPCCLAMIAWLLRVCAFTPASRAPCALRSRH